MQCTRENISEPQLIRLQTDVNQSLIELIVIALSSQYFTTNMVSRVTLTYSTEVIIEYLVNLDVGDRTGKTALHHAAYNGHVEMVSLLLLKGASVKARDRCERTPLHYAAYMG